MILGVVLSGLKNFVLWVLDYTILLMKSTTIDLKRGDLDPQGIVSDL